MTPQPPAPPNQNPANDPALELTHEPLPARQPTQPAAVQTFRQLLLSERELERLKGHIWDQFLGAKSNHERQVARFRTYYRMWRSLNTTRGSAVDGPDYQVPMVKWITSGQWARCMNALLGDDAEIIAEPRTPEGDRSAVKVGHYMSWRFFEYMQAIAQLSPFVFRAILFGRSFAEIEYEQEFYWERRQRNDRDLAKEMSTAEKAGRRWIRNQDGSVDIECLCYDGPRLRALWPSQVIVPAQDDVSNVSEFAWKIRRDRLTPQQLLDGEARGRYQGVTENWRAIMAEASQRQERDWWWDDERIDADEAEGVDHGSLLGNRDSVEVWRWFGKWRLPKGRREPTVENLSWRSQHESELVVTYLPKPGIVVGVQDLRDLYPRMRKRDPLVDLALMKDGSYFSPGFGELLAELQDESTINHALFRKAGQLSVGPIIFYKPSSGGFDPEEFEYSPNTAIPCEDPANVKLVTMGADLSYAEKMQQLLKIIAELVTGVSDQSNGQPGDTPNTPKTASGQAMLLQEGNVRASLDMLMLKDDMSRILSFVWELDCEYADPEVFFRATGDDANGLFDTVNGFGSMTSEDRSHAFGFDLKFATSNWSREARKQIMMQLYTLSIANPIVQTNPRALWTLLNRVWEANGEKTFNAIIPEPPETDRPRSPKEEWTMLLAGEDVEVNPLDDDKAHVMDHRSRLQQAAFEAKENPARKDPRLMRSAMAHIIMHEQQIRRKMALQELVTAAANELQQRLGGQPPPGAPPSGPAGPGAWTPPVAPPPGAAPPGAPGVAPGVPSPQTGAPPMPPGGTQ